MRDLGVRLESGVPNELLTLGWITKEGLRLFRNTNYFLRSIGRQYDDAFGRTGAKIGTQLRIRLPNDYVVRVGPTAYPQSTNEMNMVLTLATQKGVDVAFSSAEREMSLDDYRARILAPAINVLAGDLAASIMSDVPMASNLVRNADINGNTISPTAGTWLAAGALLDMMSAPRVDRFIVMDPLTQSRTVTSLMGLFNPQDRISRQYIRGTMATDTLGFDAWGMDQTVVTHVTGNYGSNPAATTVGANQLGANLTITPLAGNLNKGDIFTLDGVYSVNRVTKRPNALLQQFVLMADAPAGSTTLAIYPPIVTYNPATNMPQPYQTVNVAPAAGAALNVATAPGEVYRKNFAYFAEAFTMATADLEVPQGVHEAARETYDGISMRMVTDYAVMSDQFITRLDILYGSAVLRPEWIVAVADVP